MIHVVAGPTASGKTAYAQNLAAQITGVLINVDSRQVYKYLDIGTNKDPQVPIKLISFLNPDQAWSAFEHRDLVHQEIAAAQAAGKVPILVGGTGLYLDVILHPSNYAVSPPAQANLRAELAGLELIELQLRALDANPEAEATLNPSDWNNPHRLTRLIEKSLVPAEAQEHPAPVYNYTLHYPEITREQLFARINQRVLEMWDQGLVAEVEKVLALGYAPDATALQGIGYRQVLAYLARELNQEDCIAQIQAAHRQYAKRQETWFRKYLLGIRHENCQEIQYFSD